MSGLEQAFYIIAIVFMAVMFVLIIALLTMVFVIRRKINKIHDNIEAKINSVTSIAEKGGELAAMAAGGMIRRAKKAVKK